MEAYNDKPLEYFELDTTTADLTGNGYTFTVSGSGRSVGLGNGFANSTTLSKSAVGTFTSPVFIQGYESQPFTLEATVRSIAKSAGYTAQTYRENLATNPSAETGTTNWTVWGGTGGTVAMSQQTTGGVSGTGFVRGTWSVASTTNGDISYAISSNTQFSPGDPVSFAIYIRANTARAFTSGIQWQDSGGNVLSTTNGTTTATIPANTWTRLVMNNVIMPVGASRFKVMARAATAMAATDVMDADAVIIEKSTSVGTYFDGSMPGYEWVGAANASISRTRTDISRVNLADVPQPTAYSASTTIVRWGTSRWFGGGSGAGNYTITTGTSPVGNTYATKTWTVVGSFNADTGFDNTTGAPGVLRVYPGETITFSAYMRSSSPNVKQGKISVYQYNGAGTAFTTARNDGPSINLNQNVWTRVSYTYIVPADVYGIGIATDIAGTGTLWQVGESLDATGLLIERSSTLNTFFDGATLGASWSGTANASPSLLLVSISEQQILGNVGNYDGLLINGTVISFVTKYLTTGECRASYDIQTEQRVHVVGVHTVSKNALYVNGELVAVTSVTDAQKADKYSSASSTLSSGGTVSSRLLAVNGVATYGYALPSERVAAHWEEINRNGGAYAAVNSYAGRRFASTINEASLFLNEQYLTSEDWLDGQAQNVNTANQQLSPTFTNNVSEAGNWITAVPLDASGATSVYGVNILWDGIGGIVEASLDASTWITVTEGVNLSIIPSGFNPTNQVLYIRVSFPAGLTTAYLDNLMIRGFLSSTAAVTSDRSVTFTGTPYIKNDASPADLRDDWGTYLNNGTMILGAETDADQTGAQAIEIWFKQGPGTTLSRSFSASSTYVNGVAGTPAVGEWSHVIYNLAAPLTGSITLGGDVQIGQIVLYDNTISASQAQAIHDAYVGTRIIRMDNGSAISLVEASPAAQIYAFNWSLPGTG